MTKDCKMAMVKGLMRVHCNAVDEGNVYSSLYFKKPLHKHPPFFFYRLCCQCFDYLLGCFHFKDRRRSTALRDRARMQVFYWKLGVVPISSFCLYEGSGGMGRFVYFFINYSNIFFFILFACPGIPPTSILIRLCDKP